MNQQQAKNLLTLVDNLEKDLKTNIEKLINVVIQTIKQIKLIPKRFIKN
ncbi:hypothetical protein [Mesoplasma chauliocola]|nr:hypothetical protein [Mesoplasma chauliocola]